MVPVALARQATAWQYLDEARTHAVAAVWHRRRPDGSGDPSRAAALLDDRVVVREWAQGSSSEQVFPARAPWEAQLALWTLEARLALLGAYWRRTGGAGGWVKIAPPRGAPIPDLRPAQITDRIVLHHYHDPTGRLDELIAAVPHHGRYQVVRAELELPGLAVGRVRLIHDALVAPLMRSALVHEQVVRIKDHRPKLVTAGDYDRALGWNGARRAAEALEAVEGRVVDRQWERPPPAPPEDDVFAIFLGMLDDPRLLALHTRYLAQGDEDPLLVGGAPAIHRHMATLRAQVPHQEQHLLTLLEASLLARERLRSGQLTRFDPEVRALTRLAYYL